MEHQPLSVKNFNAVNSSAVKKSFKSEGERGIFDRVMQQCNDHCRFVVADAGRHRHRAIDVRFARLVELTFMRACRNRTLRGSECQFRDGRLWSM